MTPGTEMTEFLPVILPLVWGAILAFAVFLYVLLGGYDLGLGVLFPLAPSHEDRDAMMGSVSPFWDGNETWLVLGGGGLLAAFPLAYSVMLPALYLPIILMLIGLILRGVAFEFRFKSSTNRWVWDLAFTGGSIVAALMQGLVLGAFLQGF
jgi:cytochrome d ubiquinol oxidase subunit II